MNRSLVVVAALLVPIVLRAQATPVVPQPATTLSRLHPPEPTSADISARDLMTRLYIFADDSMQGREAGTIGNVKGTDYIAAEVKRMGLTPGATTAHSSRRFRSRRGRRIRRRR